MQPEGLEAFPVPEATDIQRNLLAAAYAATLSTEDSRFDELIDGLVYEIYFPKELHDANIRLFKEVGKTGLGDLASLKGKNLNTAATSLAENIFTKSHSLSKMLTALQGVEVVKIVEGVKVEVT